MRFAEEYPAEEEARTAVRTFGTWTAIRDSLVAHDRRAPQTELQAMCRKLWWVIEHRPRLGRDGTPRSGTRSTRTDGAATCLASYASRRDADAIREEIAYCEQEIARYQERIARLEEMLGEAEEGS
jgi:hypothetical protein